MRPLQFEKKLEKLIWVCWGDTFEKDVFVSLGNVLFRPLAEETKPELRSAFQVDSWCEPKTDLTQRDFSFFFGARVCPKCPQILLAQVQICKMGNTNVGNTKREPMVVLKPSCRDKKCHCQFYQLGHAHGPSAALQALAL